LFKSDLIGGFVIFCVLILIEFVDLARTIVAMISKEKKRSTPIFWLLNILLPPLNGKRIFAHFLRRPSKSFCDILRNDSKIVALLDFSDEISSSNFVKHLIVGFVHIVMIYVLLCVIDTGVLNDRINRMKTSAIDETTFNEEQLDEDVREERQNLLSDEYSSIDPLVLLDIVKKYPGKEQLAVNHLTLRVEKGQCFGLLGFNGAGETDTRKSDRNVFCFFDCSQVKHLFFKSSLVKKKRARVQC
jgi:hypothetical protein